MTESVMMKIILLTCGGVLLCFCFYLARKNILFLKKAVKTRGRVKEIVMADSPKKLYTPVIEFIIPAGEKVSFSPKSSSNKSTYRTGREVTVVYDPDFPEDAKIKSFFNLWFGPLVLLIAAGLLFLPGIGLSPGQAPEAAAGSAAPAAEVVPTFIDQVMFFLLHVFFPGFFILVGAILAGMGIKTALKMISSLSWPTARGIVLQSEVSGSGRYYSPKIKYVFRVKRKKYESCNVNLAKVESGDPLPSKKAVKRYPAGKEVTVYYNPKKPDDCVLEPGVKAGGLLLFFAGGAAFLFFGWIMTVVLSRGWIK